MFLRNSKGCYNQLLSKASQNYYGIVFIIAIVVLNDSTKRSWLIEMAY